MTTPTMEVGVDRATGQISFQVFSPTLDQIYAMIRSLNASPEVTSITTGMGQPTQSQPSTYAQAVLTSVMTASGSLVSRMAAPID